MPWYTNKETGGKFNTDWVEEDEKQKERQIKENEKQAAEKNDTDIYKEWTDKEARKEYSKYDYDVNSDDWKNATMYTGGRYYTSIQRALYSGDMKQSVYGGEVKDMTPYIKALDNSMRPLSENVELSRHIGYTQWENSIGVDVDSVMKIVEGGQEDYSVLDKVVGNKIHLKGYCSTSYNEKQNANAEGYVFLKLQVPKGTNAIVTGNKLESEIVLHRDLDYEITGYKIREVGGGRKQILFTAKVKEK